MRVSGVGVYVFRTDQSIRDQRDEGGKDGRNWRFDRVYFIPFLPGKMRY